MYTLSLHEFAGKLGTFPILAQTSVVATELKIAGLFESAVECYNRLLATILPKEPERLANDLRDETELQTWFSGPIGMYCRLSPETRHDYVPFMVRVLGDNFLELSKKEAFQELLGNYPQLTMDLSCYMVEENHEMASFVLEALGKKLARYLKIEAFQEMLERSPKLASGLLGYMVKKNRKLRKEKVKAI
jgi:hypothetical protein